MGLPLSKFSLFIDAEAEPHRIQNFHICRNSLNPDFSACWSTEFDSILPHDILHYKFKIWVIDYPTVFISFQSEPRVLKGIDQNPSDHKRHLNFPSQDILIPLHSFSSESGETESEGGICRI